MAQIIDLGNIRFNWVGAYNAATQYEYNDMVTYGPSLYAYTSAVATTGNAPTNAAYWALVVEGFTWRGMYADGTLYYKNDVVTDGLSTFISTAQHTSSVLDINDDADFSLLAQGSGNLPAQISAINKVLSTDGVDPQWVDTTYLTKQYLGHGQGQNALTIETSSGITNAVSLGAASVNGSAKTAFINTSNGALASTDFVAYTDTGTESSGWIDFGITSSEFNDPDLELLGPNDGYVFVSSPRVAPFEVLQRQYAGGTATITLGIPHNWTPGTTIRVEGVHPSYDGEWVISDVPEANKVSYVVAGLAPTSTIVVTPPGAAFEPIGSGNLVLGTDLSGLDNKIVFAAGGYYGNSAQMEIDPYSSVRVILNTPSTTPTTGALIVHGGVGIGGTVNIAGNVDIDGALTFNNNSQLNIDKVVAEVITITGTPTDATDAATKAYVDAIHAAMYEPTGFNRGEPDTLGRVEITLDGSTIHRLNHDDTYTKIEGATSFAAGTPWETPITANTLFMYPAPGETKFEFWQSGIRYEKETATASITPAVGTNYYFFDNGVLNQYSSITGDFIIRQAFVCELNINPDTNQIIVFANERHGITMDGATHYYLHTTSGTRFRSGLGVSGVAEGNTEYVSTGSGIIYDEDIILNIPARTDIPHLYMIGNKWNLTTADLTFARIVGGVAQYNRRVSPGNYELTNIPEGKYSVNYFIATDCIINPVMKIVGQYIFNDLATARESAQTEPRDTSLMGLPSPEFLYMGAVIVNHLGEVQTLDNGSTYVDLRLVNISAGTNSSAAVQGVAADTFYSDINTNIGVTDVQAAIDYVYDKGVTNAQDIQNVFVATLMTVI